MRLPFNDSYRVTQPFGVNPGSYKQFGMVGHNGIDYGLPAGTPVVAATAGVAYVLSDPPGFGNYIEVIGSEYKTVYAHLRNASVANGQRVAEGEQIGVSNNTGNSSGPHLHFGVKPLNPDNTNGFLGAIDPQPILNGGNMTSSQAPVDETTIRLAYNLGVNRDPVGDEWKVHLKVENAEKLLRNFLASAEHIKFVQQASAFTSLSEKVKSQQGVIIGLDGQLVQLQAKLEAASQTPKLPEAPAKGLVDYSTDDLLSEVFKRIWGKIKA